LIPGQSVFGSHPVQWSPALNANWNSGCTPVSGVFQANVAGNPSPVNCAAFEDPSSASISAGGGYVFGNIPSAVSWWRSPGYKNEDFAFIKRTSIREGKDILFKFDITNIFNRHTFGGIDGNPYDSFFGVPGGGGHSTINGTNTGQRGMQATLRYEF
jgi:hypothetical protein